MLETIGDGGGSGDACVAGVVVDPQPETCRLVFVDSTGGSYAFAVLLLNDSAVTFWGTGIGGTGGLEYAFEFNPPYAGVDRL